MSRKRVLIHAISWTTLVVFIIIASVLGIHFTHSSKQQQQLRIPNSTSSNSLHYEESPNTANNGEEEEDEFIVPDKEQTYEFLEEQLKMMMLNSNNNNQSAKMTIVGSSSLVKGDPVSEVRSTGGGGGIGSSGSGVSSRPAYQKSAPYKPKLVLAKQLQIQNIVKNNENKENPNQITQTVYGFLDFTTTVGNTVMVFTPQTKKVELIEPSSSTSAIPISQTATNEDETTEETTEDTSTKATTNISSSTARQPKLIPMNTEEEYSQEGNVSTQLESSEAEILPQETISTTQKATTAIQPNLKSKKGGSSSVEYVSFVAAAAPAVPTSTPAVEIRTQVNVVSSSDDENKSTSQTTPPSSTTPKGFTLKLSNKLTTTSSPPSTSSSVIGNGTIISSEDPELVPEDEQDQDQEGFEDGEGEEEQQQEEEGQEEEHEIQPTSSIVIIEPTPTTTTTIPKKEEQATFYILPQKNSKNSKEKPAEIYVSTSPAPDSYSRQPQLYVDISPAKSSFDYIVTATPTNSFGRKQFRQKQQLTTSSAATTATTAAGGTQNQGTRSDHVNRFSNRFSRKQQSTQSPPSSSSTESNELGNSYEQQQQFTSPEEPTITRTRGNSNNNRFRSRNRKSYAKDEQIAVQPTTTSGASIIYSNPVTVQPSTTATRRFTSGGNGNGNGNNRSRIGSGNKSYEEESNNKGSGGNNGNYKSRGGNYSPGRSKVTITPTTSTSIYRFKLNRPTGRWRFKPSPKPKVSIIKSKETDPESITSPTTSDDENNNQQRELLQQQSINGPIYHQQQQQQQQYIDSESYQYGTGHGHGGHYNGEQDTTGTGQGQQQQDPRAVAGAESNELIQEDEQLTTTSTPLELLPQTIRVATITPTEFINDLDNNKYLIEIATIKSPYVFQAGNVKNTRYITVTKTFTKEIIQPTQTLEIHETLENILATRAPYEKILEGSNDVATLPVVILGEDMATPPLETITQTFSTTELMLKTSILPALYDGVTTLYTLTQSYFVTRLVTAHKTVPPMELFQFQPTNSLTEFNTALQEAESEHREQLLGSESDDENETNYQQIVAAPDELKLVGSEFDLSFMDEKIPKALGPSSKSSKSLPPKKAAAAAGNLIPDLSNLTPEQLAFFRFLTANQQQQQAAAAQAQLVQQQQQQPSALPNPLLPNYFQSPIIPSIPNQQQQQINPYQLNSSPIVYDTVTTIVETKTLRILFGAKPTQTTLFSTRVVPTKVTSYVTAPQATAAIIPPQQQQQPVPYFQAGAYPLAAFVG